jgi:hypothetical protein
MNTDRKKSAIQMSLPISEAFWVCEETFCLVFIRVYPCPSVVKIQGMKYP